MTQWPDTEKVPGRNKAAGVSSRRFVVSKEQDLSSACLITTPVDRHRHLVFHARAADVHAPAFRDLTVVRLIVRAQWICPVCLDFVVYP